MHAGYLSQSNVDRDRHAALLCHVLTEGQTDSITALTPQTPAGLVRPLRAWPQLIKGDCGPVSRSRTFVIPFTVHREGVVRSIRAPDL